MTKTKRLLFSNTAIQLIGKAISTTSNLLVTFLIIRFLGATLYGDFTKSLTLIFLFYVLLDFGLNAVVVRRIGKSKGNEIQVVSSLIKLRFLLSLLLISLLAIILLIIPTTINQGFTKIVKLSTFLFSFSLITQGFFGSLNSLFQHKQNYFPVVISGTLSTLITLLTTLFVLRFQPSLFGIINAHLLGSLSMAVISLLYAKKYFKTFNFKINFNKQKKLLKEALPLGIFLAINALINKTGAFLLTLLRPTLEVGWYGLAQRIFDAVLILPLFFINAAYPQMIIRYQKGPNIFKSFVLRSAILLLFSSLIIAPTLILLSPLVRIFSQDIINARPALIILSLFLPAFFISVILQWTLITLNKESLLTKIYAQALLINVVINALLISKYGYMGVAITTGITEVFILIQLLYFVIKSIRNYDPIN